MATTHTLFSFTRMNCVVGWCCFVIAALTYWLTLEPTVSFWDCGEFIAAADKLQVCHPPGAPLFLMLSRIFALFTSEPAQVARCINAFSALASAFTVLFLFWSITHIAARVLIKNEASGKLQTILAGVAGSLAYAFSDSFWFSAVEGEVYAASSLFTAVVFWAVLRWESEADKHYANRWLVLIAFLMGLSIGVHLLNLLAIPAIVLVYYFKRYKASRKGILIALGCSFLILAAILYGIIPWTVKLAGYFELFFVNGLGFPYNSGVMVYLILLVALLTGGLLFTWRHKKALAHTVWLFVTVIVLGYSSYAMIVIRSAANPPMDENSPDNVFSLMSYLNREQYGDRPLLYGPYYNAPETDRVETDAVYTKLDGRYVITHHAVKQVFDERFMTVFPRMYSHNPSHIEVYKQWGDVKGRAVRVKDSEGKSVTIMRPTFGENMRFFLTYQLGHMYLRYFLWNFVGRQNDTQADGGITNGNWLCGISAIDAIRLGPQNELPEAAKNDASRNVYFFLPLLLGIVGMIWQFGRDRRYFWVLAVLFVMTGVAIVVYLNQNPLQPRERDYAYAGSFYTFAVWIGLGVCLVFDILNRYTSKIVAMAATVVATAAVPALMLQQNYDDHDRSAGYTAHDIARNYLMSCAPNAILFTIGDNDTFPLWYLQDVEGVRTDVRVVNLMLLNADWYISQLKCATSNAMPVPFALPETSYLTGLRDLVYLAARDRDTLDLRKALDFVNSDEPKTKTRNGLAYFPGRVFSLAVDRQKALASGAVEPAMSDSMLDRLTFRINATAITKSQWATLEIIAANQWERPIYWTSCRLEGSVGLDDYLQLEGTAYRLVPLRTPSKDGLFTGRIDTATLYPRLMDEFRWGRFGQKGVWADQQSVRTANIVKARHLYTRLALKLLEERQPERAVAVLSRALKNFPPEQLPYDYFSLFQAQAFFLAGQPETAVDVLRGFAHQCVERLRYFYSLPDKFFAVVEHDAQQEEALLGEITRIAEAQGEKALAEEIVKLLNSSR